MRMMKRLEKLEAEKSKGDGLRVLAQNDGETSDECIKRYGFDPMARGVAYVLANKLDVLI